MAIQPSASPREEAIERYPKLRRMPALPLVIVFVLLAEVAVRLVSGQLREPLLWPDFEAQNKVAAMDALGAKAGAVVAFVGSSAVNAAFDPQMVTRLLGRGAKRPVFNAALNGSDLRTTAMWTRSVVVPRLRPSVVVIGFNGGEANDNWDQQGTLFHKFEQSPRGREITGEAGTMERIESWFVERSYLVRYRNVLRHPADALESGKKRRRDAGRVSRLGNLVALRAFQQRPFGPGLSRALGIWDEMFERYHVGGRQFQALEGLVNDLTSKNIKVIVVRMPTTGIEELFPNRAADHAAFDRALAEFAARHPGTVVDAETAVGHSTDLFVDALHVNTAGMQRSTAYIVDQLKTRF